MKAELAHKLSVESVTSSESLLLLKSPSSQNLTVSIVLSIERSELGGSQDAKLGTSAMLSDMSSGYITSFVINYLLIARGFPIGTLIAIGSRCLGD